MQWYLAIRRITQLGHRKCAALGRMLADLKRSRVYTMCTILLTTLSSGWIIIVAMRVPKPQSCLIFSSVLLLIFIAEFCQRRNYSIWRRTFGKIYHITHEHTSRYHLCLEKQRYLLLAVLCSDIIFERIMMLSVIAIIIPATAITNTLIAILDKKTDGGSDNMHLTYRAIAMLIVMVPLKTIWHWPIAWIPFIMATTIATIANLYSQQLRHKNDFLFPIVTGCSAAFLSEVL